MEDHNSLASSIPEKLVHAIEPISSTPSFPSPSSSFIPPPMPDAHEFAVKASRIIAARRKDPSLSTKQPTPTSAGDSTSAKSAISRHSPTQDDDNRNGDSNSATPVAELPSKLPFLHHSSPETRPVKSPVGEGEGTVAGRARPISDPRGAFLSRSSPGQIEHGASPKADPTQQLPSTARSKHLSTPPTSSALSALNGINNASSTPPASTYLISLPDSKRSSLASSRPAPPSPTPSRHSSLIPSRRPSKRASRGGHAHPLTSSQKKRASAVIIKIRDFAFHSSDERHSTVRRVSLRKRRSSRLSTDSRSRDDNRKSSGGWSGLLTAAAGKFGFGAFGSGNNSGTNSKRSSRISTSSRRSKQIYYDEPPSDDYASQDSYYSSEGDQYYDAAGGEYADGEQPFVPGVYRALYQFDPEGTAEMALEEDQMVRCLGRGGGVGWVIAIKEGAAGNHGGVAHALVPEGYLEFVRPFADGELEGDEEHQSSSSSEDTRVDSKSAAIADDPGTPRVS
ncbi:hypothetical protein FRC03_009239 [Tulasnella sp. 419]|nr:hypothetical protein FRC03_009239 [Tulasnella sp. 419]